MHDYLVFFAVLSVGHFLFEKSLGVELLCKHFQDFAAVLQFSLFLSVMLVLASLVNYCVYVGVLLPWNLVFLDTVVFVLLIVWGFPSLIEKLLKRFLIDSPVHESFREIAYLLLAISQWHVHSLARFPDFNLWGALLSAVAVGVSFSLSFVGIFFVQKRLLYAAVPNLLHGLPLTLIVLAFVAMALRYFHFLFV